jgi:hypothetical protein
MLCLQAEWASEFRNHHESWAAQQLAAAPLPLAPFGCFAGLHFERLLPDRHFVWAQQHPRSMHSYFQQSSDRGDCRSDSSSTRFVDVVEAPTAFQELSLHWKTIAAEYNAAVAARPDLKVAWRGGDHTGWTMLGLRAFKKDLAANQSLCPKTWQLMLELERKCSPRKITTVGFSTLSPGAIILPHTDMVGRTPPIRGTYLLCHSIATLKSRKFAAFVYLPRRNAFSPLWSRVGLVSASRSERLRWSVGYLGEPRSWANGEWLNGLSL